MVMHVRVISPSAATADIVDLLTADVAVANLVVHEGAAVQPRGDVVICDVAREAANDVVDALHSILGDSGSIALDEVAMQISDSADEAERAAPGLGSDAVVWRQIEDRTGDEARLSSSYLVFLCIATVIAGIGVLLDQPILIIGAMVVGPEFGPLAAVCVGIVRRRPELVWRAVVALVVGFAVAVAVTLVATLALAQVGLVDRSMLLADRPLTDFIWRPDALSWVIGFLAGVAGMLSLTTAKSGALIGVLISVTTVPAAGNVAVALAFGVTDEAAGSALQLLINAAAIVVAGVLTLIVQGWFTRSGRSVAQGSPASGRLARGRPPTSA